MSARLNERLDLENDTSTIKRGQLPDHSLLDSTLAFTPIGKEILDVHASSCDTPATALPGNEGGKREIPKAKVC